MVRKEGEACDECWERKSDVEMSESRLDNADVGMSSSGNPSVDVPIKQPKRSDVQGGRCSNPTCAKGQAELQNSLDGLNDDLESVQENHSWSEIDEDELKRAQKLTSDANEWFSDEEYADSDLDPEELETKKERFQNTVGEELKELKSQTQSIVKRQETFRNIRGAAPMRGASRKNQIDEIVENTEEIQAGYDEAINDLQTDPKHDQPDDMTAPDDSVANEVEAAKPDTDEIDESGPSTSNSPGM